MRENQTRILQAHTVSKRVRGSENYEEMMSEEIWGLLHLSWTLLCRNYYLYDIWYYHKHFGITGETKFGHFSVHPVKKTWGTDALNATNSRRAGNLVALKTRILWVFWFRIFLVVFEVDSIYFCIISLKMLRNKTELSIVGRSQQRYFPRQKVSNTEKKKLSLYHGIPRRQKSRRILKSFYK